MSTEVLNNQNEDFLYENKKELKELKNEIDVKNKKKERKEQKKIKKMKEKREKEVSDFIATSIIYDKFLESVAKIQISKDPKEREEKIKMVRDSFTKDWIIVYQDETWLEQEIKDIEGFLNEIAEWKKTVNYLIDTDQYITKWAITLEKKSKKIKKIQLNANLKNAR